MARNQPAAFAVCPTRPRPCSGSHISVSPSLGWLYAMPSAFSTRPAFWTRVPRLAVSGPLVAMSAGFHQDYMGISSQRSPQ